MRRAKWPLLLACVVLLPVTSACGHAPEPAPGHAATSAPSSGVPASSTTGDRIMGTTGAGFTVCGVDGDAPPYSVTVCGDVTAAKAALEAAFPGQVTVVPYQPGDGGAHAPQDLVLQYWVNHTTGPGFTIVSTRIVRDGQIDVGVSGDLAAARKTFDQRFPGKVSVHPAEQLGGGAPVVTKRHP